MTPSPNYYLYGSHLVELDRRGAAAVGSCHNNVPPAGKGDVSQRHTAPQPTQALTGRQQGSVGLQQGHGHQAADGHRQPAFHRLTPEQSE